jgi:hypothetical protein
MDAMAFPRFDTKPGMVRMAFAGKVALALEEGIKVVPGTGGEWQQGQRVEVLLCMSEALAVREPKNRSY